MTDDNIDEFTYHLKGPRGHHIIDGFPWCFGQMRPKVFRDSVLVTVLCQVVVKTFAERLVTDVIVQHTNDGGTFRIGNIIEDFINFRRMP